MRDGGEPARRGEQSTRNGEARGNERGARAAMQYPTLDNGKHHLSVRPCDSVRAIVQRPSNRLFFGGRERCVHGQISRIRNVDIGRTSARNRSAKGQVPRNFRENIRLIHLWNYNTFQFGLPQIIC